MQPTEAVTLCRLAKAFCPQQQFDEFTADAWGEALAPFRFEDCKQALVEHIRQSPFISPAEIIDGVKRIRRDRIMAHPPMIPPTSLDPEDTAGYGEWFNSSMKAIGDGEILPQPPMVIDVGEGKPPPEWVRELRRKAEADIREGLGQIEATAPTRPTPAEPEES